MKCVGHGEAARGLVREGGFSADVPWQATNGWKQADGCVSCCGVGLCCTTIYMNTILLVDIEQSSHLYIS